MQTATLIVAILAAYLSCFGVLALLVGRRLPQAIGMRDLGWATLLLSASYVLQLLGGPPGWSLHGVLNHTLSTLGPMMLAVGLRRFIHARVPSAPTLWALALGYTLVQLLLEPLAGPSARYVLLSGVGTAIMLCISTSMWRGSRAATSDMRWELRALAVVSLGFALLNALKAIAVTRRGLDALALGQQTIARLLAQPEMATELEEAVTGHQQPATHEHPFQHAHAHAGPVQPVTGPHHEHHWQGEQHGVHATGQGLVVPIDSIQQLLPRQMPHLPVMQRRSPALARVPGLETQHRRHRQAQGDQQDHVPGEHLPLHVPVPLRARGRFPFAAGSRLVSAW